MAISGFYDAGVLRQAATKLFHDWGYNAYRIESELRADDQLVRGKTADLLGLAKASVRQAEAEYRRKFLPSPALAKPFPDHAAIEAAQQLEGLARAIGALEALTRQQTDPGDNRMPPRYRQEVPILKALLHYDEQLVGQCELLRSVVSGQDGASILTKLPDLEGGLEAIRGTLLSRETVLLERVL